MQQKRWRRKAAGQDIRECILEGKKPICFPGFEKYLTGADVTPERVVLDGHIFTSKGMGTAIDLGLAIVKEISGEEASEELAKSIQYR